MPFIPHTQDDVRRMLSAIGATEIEQLFDEIPSSLRQVTLKDIPKGLPEQDVLRLMQQRGKSISHVDCYLGAGAYEHHIPAAVWDIVMRGEFLTAYTPYQAEASQGTLQVVYEFQTMIASLMGMDVANASLYEGASALAEAILMSVRLQRQSTKRILMLGTIHPYYRDTVQAIVSNQDIELIEIPYDIQQGVPHFNN